jgi:hypothetical protein
MARQNRAPFDHEKAVDFGALRAVLDHGLNGVHRVWNHYRPLMIDEYCDRLASIATLAQLPTVRLFVPASGAPMALDLGRELVEVSDESAAVAVDEAKRQGVTAIPAAPGAGVMSARAIATTVMFADHVTVTGASHVLRLTPGPIDTAVIARVRRELQTLKWTWVTDQLLGSVSAAAHWGRVETLRPPDITAAVGPGVSVRWYASELLDQATCPPCGGIDGRNYASLDAALVDYPAGGYRDCAGLTRCRGTLVAVYDR